MYVVIGFALGVLLSILGYTKFLITWIALGFIFRLAHDRGSWMRAILAGPLVIILEILAAISRFLRI